MHTHMHAHMYTQIYTHKPTLIMPYLKNHVISNKIQRDLKRVICHCQGFMTENSMDNSDPYFERFNMDPQYSEHKPAVSIT